MKSYRSREARKLNGNEWQTLTETTMEASGLKRYQGVWFPSRIEKNHLVVICIGHREGEAPAEPRCGFNPNAACESPLGRASPPAFQRVSIGLDWIVRIRTSLHIVRRL